MRATRTLAAVAGVSLTNCLRLVPILFVMACQSTGVLESPQTGSKPSVPVEVALGFSDSPILNREVGLVFTVSPRVAVAEAKIEFQLPDGIEWVSGDTKWTGSLVANETKEFALVTRSVTTGDWVVSASVANKKSPNDQWEKTATVYVTVTDIGAKVSATTTPTGPSDPRSTAEPSSKPSVPVDAALSFSDSPILNREVALVFTVSPRIAITEAEVEFHLPEGIELVSGDTKWRGSLTANETKDFSILIKVIAVGDWEVSASVTEERHSDSWARKATVYASVSETGAKALAALPSGKDSDKLKAEFVGFAEPSVGNPDKPSQIKHNREWASPLTVGGTVKLYGYWYYRDKNNIDRAMPDARVEIWESDPLFDTLLATIYTNDYGYWESTVSNNDGIGQGGIDTYVKIFTTDDYSVKVTTFWGVIYNSSTPIVSDIQDGSRNIGSWAVTDPDKRMANFIYDKLANPKFSHKISAAQVINSILKTLF